jgi:hypothetical protein
MPAVGRFCSLIPGLGVKFSVIIPCRGHCSLRGRRDDLRMMALGDGGSSMLQSAHYPLAMKAGLDAKVADELALGKRPSAMSDDEAAVYEFCIQLHRTRNVDDATFNRALALFGERGVVDLIGVSGYYTAVSMTLNVAHVMPPEGTALPLK